MQKVKLRIENPYESKTIALEDEITLGRTDASQVVLSDTGLSRKNTTFFRDGDQVLVVDENSTNGTFLNGEKISGAPVRVFDGDRLTVGNETEIRVEIGTGREEAKAKKAEEERKATASVAAGNSTTSSNPKSQIPNPKSNKPPMILIVAGASTLLILFLGVVALLIARSIDPGKKNGPAATTAISSAVIPVRVIDPLGGEDPDDLDDIIAGWELEEKELDVATVRDVTTTEATANDDDEKRLIVPASLLADRKAKAFERRTKETGIRPAGLQVPKELFGDGVIKQKIKLGEMMKTAPPYEQPMDFSDLAKKRLNKQLLEMPMATQSFYLEVGGSAEDTPFTAFSFQTSNTPILKGSDKYKPLEEIAAKYGVSLDNAADRKQIRMRLLRMFNPNAREVLEEVANAYFQRFNRPLRVTSLTRSMDYQILLNKSNANSFIVRGAGSLPPHTSGCAFDLARKHMDVEEQNFLMAKLAEMERDGKLDALIEYGVNACFHIFIYHDKRAPAM